MVVHPRAAAKQGLAEAEALKKGMEEKSKVFVEKGAGVCSKTAKSRVTAPGLPKSEPSD